jgi:glycopeptide antibiotics resistance protein
MEKMQPACKLPAPVFFSSYFVFLLYIVFFSRRRQHLHTRMVNLVPVKKSLQDLQHLTDIGSFNYYTNLIGNVVLFIPVAFALIIIFNVKKISTVIIGGGVLSFMIELLQYSLLRGVADIDDIILNTLGTAAGCLLYGWLKK